MNRRHACAPIPAPCVSMLSAHISIPRLRSVGSLFLWVLLLILGIGSGETFADEPAQLVKVLVTYHSLSGNTERMAEAVAEGARSLPGAEVLLKRVGQVTAEDLFSADAVVVGSPVYWSNMSGEVKTFFDNWQFKFGVFPEFKMKNKVGAAFATGGQLSSGKEVTMLTILAAMLGNQMIVVSGGGAFGASATTEGDSPGIDNRELADAKALGRRVAEITAQFKAGSAR
ncbi:MAG: NAD(P)H-dependent oxidoreductase [Nitrospirae bacterium]|nr:NAD(P)H-dependent oxidoreductase [Nitrospirota bacterium]